MRGEDIVVTLCRMRFTLAAAFIPLCVLAAFKMEKDLELQAELREFVRQNLQVEDIKER